MSAADGFEILDTGLIAETPFLRLEELSLQSPRGEIAARTVVRVGGAVAIIPIDGDDVILIKQYRSALDRALLELPAGKLDVPGEERIETAHRELSEEVGLAAGTLELLSHYFTSPGFTDEEVTIYVATDLTEVEMNRIGPEEEAAEIVRIPIADIPELLRTLEDSKTIIGLQALLMQRAGLI